MLPACYGSKSTVYEYFQRWSKVGVMAEIFHILLAEYEERIGIDARWQATDGSLLQAPTLPQKSTTEGFGSNPSDRGRSGSKIRLHVDGQSIP